MSQNNLYVQVTHDAPAGLEEGDKPERYWRADVVVQGVFGADKTVLATGFGREDPGNGQKTEQAQGQAITLAWHNLWQSLEVRRP